MSPRAMGSNPAALTSAASSVTTENHSDSTGTPTSEPEQTSSACTEPVPSRLCSGCPHEASWHAEGRCTFPGCTCFGFSLPVPNRDRPATPEELADEHRRYLASRASLSVTHGKNGVLPLPAQPDPHGCESYPVTSEDRAQEDAVSEIWEECDACQSDNHGHTLTGRLCARHRQQRLREIETGMRAGADLRERQRLTLDSLQVHGVLSPAESEQVRECMRVFAVFIDEAMGTFTDAQGRAFLIILRDFAARLMELTGGVL